VRGANGERQFVSGAFDWQISPDALLQLDIDYQHKAQITAPGFQLIRNEDPADRRLGQDAAERPALDPSGRHQGHQPRPALRIQAGARLDATVAANKHWFKRDDYTAFPYGCSNEGDGYYPGYCSNGDYDVYDYQSVGERKTPWGAQAMVQGKFATGAMRHALTVGAPIRSATTASATTSTTTSATAISGIRWSRRTWRRTASRAPCSSAAATRNARCSCRTSCASRRS
jgi:iron complex outermembrane receptor protein